MFDHRVTDRLITYWENLRHGGTMPEFEHLNASAMGDLWQHCVLFTVGPAAPGQKPTISFYRVGDQLRSIYGPDMLGKAFSSQSRHFQGAAIVRKIDAVLTNPAPLVDNGQFVSEANKIVKYRSCLLPFGKDTVTHVVAGLSWKEY